MRTPRRGRSLLVALCLATACVARGEGRGQAPSTVPTIGGVGGVTPALRPAFATLAGAVSSGEDDLARSMIAGLRLRTLGENERALLDAFERVLTGRELVRALALSVASEPLADEGRYRLVLTAENLGARPVRLRLPPADLTRVSVRVDERGSERRELDTRSVRALGELTLGAGARRELDLLDYDLPLGQALAVRERWRLETRSGEIDSGGVIYPAAQVRVAPCERIRLRADLAQAAVLPAELAAFVAATETLETRDLLERVVRVPAERRAEALRGLAPLVERWAREDPERVTELAPALRWLSGNARLGGDPRAWSRYLQTRLTQEEQAPDLDLPDGRGAPALRTPLELP